MIQHNFHSHYYSMAVAVDYYYCYDDERLKLVMNFYMLGVYERCYLLESSLFYCFCLFGLLEEMIYMIKCLSSLQYISRLDELWLVVFHFNSTTL